MSTTAKYARYLFGALLIGAFWFLNRDRPLWEEVGRTIVVFSVIMIVLRLRLKRKGVEVHLVRLIAGKATLVVLAAVIEYVLRQNSVEHSSLIVSIGLGLAIFAAGALFDRSLFTLAPAAAGTRAAGTRPGLDS